MDARSAPRHNFAVDEEDHDRADYRNDNAVEIEPGDASQSQAATPGLPPTIAGRQRNIHRHACTGLVDDFAADEARNQAQNDPAHNAHEFQSPSSSPRSAAAAIDGLALSTHRNIRKSTKKMQVDMLSLRANILQS